MRYFDLMISQPFSELIKLWSAPAGINCCDSSSWINVPVAWPCHRSPTPEHPTCNCMEEAFRMRRGSSRPEFAGQRRNWSSWQWNTERACAQCDWTSHLVQEEFIGIKEKPNNCFTGKYQNWYRTCTIYVGFQSHVFHNVLWVLIVDARSFQVFLVILDWLIHLASISCWHRSDSRWESQAALLWISKAWAYDHVCSIWSAKKKHANPTYKATKHIKCTLLISDYC